MKLYKNVKRIMAQYDAFFWIPKIDKITEDSIQIKKIRVCVCAHLTRNEP